jgi:hypothetical protein
MQRMSIVLAPLACRSRLTPTTFLTRDPETAGRSGFYASGVKRYVAVARVHKRLLRSIRITQDHVLGGARILVVCHIPV